MSLYWTNRNWYDSVKNFCCSALGANVKKPVKNQSSSEEEEVEETVADNGRRKKSYPRGQNKRARDTTTSSNKTLKGETKMRFELIEITYRTDVYKCVFARDVCVSQT